MLLQQAKSCQDISEVSMLLLNAFQMHAHFCLRITAGINAHRKRSRFHTCYFKYNLPFLIFKDDNLANGCIARRNANAEAPAQINNGAMKPISYRNR